MSSQLEIAGIAAEREGEASKLHEHARSLVSECKLSRPVSMLEKVILLLRNVLDQHPSPYPSRSDTLRNLCLALLVRFNQWGWAVDAYEVKNLTADCIESFVLESREGDNTTARVQSAGDVELECHSETAHLALSLLNEFRRSVKHSSIDTAILTYRMVLDLRPPTTPNRALTLFELAESLVTRFHLTDQREDLDEAIALFKEATHVVHPAPDPEQYRCLLSLGMAFELRFHRYEDLDLDDDLAAIQAMEQAADEDNEAMDLSQTGSDQLEAFEQSGMNSILDTAITRLSRSLLLRPAQHPLRAMSLNNLAIALSRRFEQTGHPADLEEAISLQREALNLHVAPHPNRCMYLNNLAAAFHTRFEQSGYLPDLEEAVDVHREALELRPCLHPDRFMSLHNLADALLERFKQKLYLPDLENAITLHREELELCPAPHPGRSMALDSLASALYTQFQQKDHLPDLDEAVVLHREGLSLRSTTHPGRFMQLNNFASALHAQFEQRGRLPDLEEAVALHREALSLCPPAHPCRSMSLNNLGIALSTRFEHHGHLPDLEEAISLHREELDLCPPPHPSRFKPLNNLARDLRTRFAQTGHPADLEEAISFQREALQLHPASHSDHSGSLSNLAGAVLQRFVQTGHLPDLDETIYLHRKALDLRPAPHPDRSMSLSDLARALVRRFEQKGHLPDLEEAIVLHRAALELRAATHPNHFISLNNLATTLCIRYEQMGQIPDLQEAIAWLRKALDLCHTSHPDRPTLLNNLASALDTQLERKGNLTDSEEAIALHREVLSLRPVPHPNRSISLNNLATALFTRFQQTGHLGDLTETIVLYQQSLDLLPVGDPNHCGATNLGIALIALHRDSVPEQQEHLEQAMAAFHHGALCKTAPLREQFRSSREWSRHAGIWHHTSALEAFQHTIDLLPHLSSLDMNLQARQEVLAQTSGIASEACNWAIHAGHLEKAVEFLSAARVVFWSQALHLRTPLDNLQSVSPHCAGRLRAIAAELEYTSQWNVDVSYIGHDKVQDTEKKASHRRDLNEERIRILNEVRKLPGFQDFMLPKSFDDLSSILNGPVVMLSVSMEGCDGILLTHGKVRVKHIPFLDLTPEHMLKIGDLTRAALSKTRLGIPNTLKDLSRILNEQMRGDHSRKMVRVPEPGCTSDDLFRFVLEVLWLTVACPVIDALNLTVSDAPPRLWWCPTGPFSFLPIHAAGIYDGERQVCLSNYVTSSYIPTLDTLPVPPPLSEGFSMLAVIEAETPGQSKLPCALKELEMIQKHISDTQLAIMGTKESPSSVKGISSCLNSASLVHFACHGYQDPVNPLRSALFIRDGHITIAKIMESPLPKARLAFLNACETAKGDDCTPDEVMHLSASLLFAGFHGVIGTMWSINDEDAPLVADIFYGYLFRKGKDTYPDSTEAAYALHLAVKKLRVERKVSFERWVPFIHLGI